MFKIGRFANNEAASRGIDIAHRYRNMFAVEDAKGVPRIRVGRIVFDFGDFDDATTELLVDLHDRGIWRWSTAKESSPNRR
jgi:hypothetical protein